MPVVPPAPVAVVTVTPTAARVMTGQQIQLAATITGGTAPAAWSSSDTAVATVDSSGLVVAHAVGSVTITVSSGASSATSALATTNAITVAAVTLGSNHTCGLTPDGTAYCWGSNSSGQLGNGTLSDSATPTPVSGGLHFSILSAGGNQTCGLGMNPTPSGGAAIYYWGDNSYGQLGNGTTTGRVEPGLVVGNLPYDATYKGLSVGDNHVCYIALFTALCWGANSSGQLGDGTTISRSKPVVVTLLPQRRLTGPTVGRNHTCVDIEGGSSFFITYFSMCWGDNSSGQLGNGTTTSPPGGTDAPFAFGGAGDVSAGALFTCALSDPAGGAFCWGNNDSGQLGNGTTTSALSLTTVAGGLSFYELSAGAAHVCALSISNSAAYCWGDNAYGQLGNGATTGSTVPSAVSGGLNFAWISAGASHTCGVTGNDPTGRIGTGAIYCWGDNSYGQLGNTWTTSSAIPVNVAGSQ